MEQARVNRGPIPDRILNAPVLLDGLEFYYGAFMRLSTCRQIGMGVGPVPWTAVVEYARMYEMTEDEFYRFETLIGAMDAEYVRTQTPKSEDKGVRERPPRKRK